MADRVALALHENNDEQVLLTIDRQHLTDDLTAISVLELYLKYESCDADTAPTTVKLTSASPSEIAISAQAAAQITATAHIPASALSGAFSRFWRVDGLVGSARRTAMFGPVTVEDL